jgi:uncharacterized membrane protein YkvA (DUF1232 family)
VVSWLLVALISLAGIWLLAILGLVLAGKPSAAREIATLLPNLIALFRGLRADPAVPRREKWLLLVALMWIASPIDLIPEFIPVLGPLDDALVAALVLRRLVRAAGPEVVGRHWRGSAESLAVIYRLARIAPG